MVEEVAATLGGRRKFCDRHLIQGSCRIPTHLFRVFIFLIILHFTSRVLLATSDCERKNRFASTGTPRIAQQILCVISVCMLVTTLIAALAGVVWFLQWNYRKSPQPWSLQYGPVIFGGEWYRVVTSSWCHASFTHLLMNITAGYAAMSMLESSSLIFDFLRDTLLFLVRRIGAEGGLTCSSIALGRVGQ